jgi:ribosomal protein S18 acetylase RimI-like enzyme
VLTLRQLTPDDWRLWRAVRLEALAEAPHAFGSTLQHWQGDGDIESRWRSRLEAVPFNVVALLDDAAVGQVSGAHVDERGRVELISMWVAPSARGRLIGAVLIDAVVDWAAALNASTVSLSVKRTNVHAIALYTRAGFVPSDEPTAPDEQILTKALMPRPPGAAP